jgi:2,5-diamino-6-(ribosylamino)-4(3H)-pyrimidinone 5'-phosphate reductase
VTRALGGGAGGGETVAERPEVWLNCAASLDGRIALAGGRRARLSVPDDLRRVQAMRAASDGIVVGVGTVVLDDPSLRVHWELLDGPRGKDPTRVVIDGSGRTPEKARVLDGSLPTIVVTSRSAHRTYPDAVERVVAGERRVDLRAAFAELAARGFHRLMVEGGADLLASVVRERLFDRWTIYYAPLAIGGASAPPILRGEETRDLAGAPRLELVALERLGEGYLATYRPRPSGPA